MRPRTLEEFVGQAHLVGAGRLDPAAGRGRRPAAVADPLGRPRHGQDDAGPPARPSGRRRFAPLSAVLSGVKELREAIAEARQERRRGRRTVLFIDEIHRFNKAQQDALLPAVEDGTVTLIGATTENPSFEVNAAPAVPGPRPDAPAPLTEADVATILRRALADAERGLAALAPGGRRRTTSASWPAPPGATPAWP